MLLKEIVLNESVDFNVVFWNDEKEWWSSKRKKTEKSCEACEGTGKDDYGDCMYCDGTGKYEDWIEQNPSLNVSNANASVIISQLLGLDPYSEDGLIGTVDVKDLPEIKRRLIKAKNQDQDHLIKDPIKSGGDTFVDRNDDIPRIRKTATMYDMGRSSEQVKRYIDVLIKIVDAAQQQGGTLSWA